MIFFERNVLKPLLILTRIMCVGLFWSIFFIEGIRVIMLRNWRFDIFQTGHWNHAWNLWLSGWVIDTPKEWAFILIIITFIPLWLCGWAALSMVKWENYILKSVLFPWRLFKRFCFKPVKIIANTATPKTKKKKSYKEIRPRSLTLPLDDRPEPANNKRLTAASRTKPLTAAIEAADAPFKPLPQPLKTSTPISAQPESPKQFNHSLFDIDDSKDDDFDFNIDDFDFTKATSSNEDTNKENSHKFQPKQNKELAAVNNKRLPTKNTNKQNLPTKNPSPVKSGNSSLDVIKQHGYETINGATIKNNLIDFIGISETQICLCLIDKEPGDWLADEERFNDEEPLWFSESSHRVSPVRKIDLARKFLDEKLKTEGLQYKIDAYVVIQLGNIINAEDMFDIWDDMKINVTRIDRGTPKEIKLFAKTLVDAERPIKKENFEKIKKIIRSIA